MATKRMIEISKQTPAGMQTRAVLPKDFHRLYESQGWKAGNYENGDEYVSPAQAEKLKAREAARAAKNTKPADAASAAVSGDSNAVPSGTDTHTN